MTETFAYDAVAYPSPIVAAQTPDRIAAAGVLHGWRAPDPLTASVLEIGCGDGLNLIAIAAANSLARCVGFDLSAPAIERGRELAATAGLGNVDLHAGDILKYPRTGETFDYILVHGVYSWVPEFVRTPLIELIGARLAPGGVAYMSYDCLPGAAGKRAINRFLRSRLGGIADADQQIDAALQLVGILAQNQRQESRLAQDLQRLLGREKLDRNYFFHDWLSEFYTPATAADVGAEVAAAGLEIAGDAGLSDLFLGGFDENALRLLAAERDPARRLETLDMLSGDTVFRRSLLVRRDAPPPPVADGLRSLGFAFRGTREQEDGPDGPVISYAAGGSARLTARHPVQRLVMDALTAAAPGELSLDGLAAVTGIPGDDLTDLLRLIAAVGLIECHTTPQNFVVAPGPRPLAGPLVRVMVARGPWAITPRHIKTTDYPEATRLLLTLCDGTRTLADLAAEIGRMAGAEVSVEAVESAIGALALDGIFEA